MNENHVGSRQKGVKSPNQNGCWQYSYLQIMDVLLLIFVARNLAGNVLASCWKYLLFRHKHSLKLSWVLLNNIQWCNAYKCRNAVSSCGHWLPAALLLAVQSSTALIVKSRKTRYVWYDTFCRNGSMVHNQWHLQLYASGLQKRRLPTFRPGDWAKKAWQRSNTHDL